MAQATKTVQIASTLRNGIGKRYKPGSQLPPVRNLMKEFQVSLATVRSALDLLNEEGLVETSQGKGSFVVGLPGIAAPRRLSKARSSGRGHSIIALSFSEISNVMATGPISGMEKVLSTTDCSFVFNSTLADSNRELAYLRNIEEMGVRVLVIAPVIGSILSPTYHEQLLRLQRAGVLVICLYIYLEDVPTYVVTTDDYLGGSLVAKHFLELGHRRIGLLGGTTITSDHERWNGFIDTLRSSDADLNPSLFIDMPMLPNGFVNARWPIQNLSAREDRPTAIFCNNDGVAIEVYRACKEFGLRIPEDLSIVGFDDLPEVSSYIPPLTTVKQNFEELGVAVGNIIKTHLGSNNDDCNLSEHIFHKIKPELIVRTSTGKFTI